MNLNEWLRTQWDRVLGVAAILGGLVALLLGYLGVRDALYPGQQIPYILSGGLVGLTLVGLGAVAWLSADLRDEWRLLDAMDVKLDELGARLDAVVPRPESPSAPAPASPADTDPGLASAGSSHRRSNSARPQS